MLSPGCHSLTPKLQVSDMRFPIPGNAQRGNPTPQLLGDRDRFRQCAAFQQQRELLAAEPPGVPVSAHQLMRHRENRLVAGVVAVTVVDQLEVVDVGHDRAERRALAGAQTGLHGLLEEAAAVEHAGERIRDRETDQLALHVAEALGGAKPRIKFVSRRRIVEDVVGAVVERDREPVFARRGRHQDHIDRPLAAGHQPRLPAQLQARDRTRLGRGDDRADIGIGFDAGQRLVPVGEGAHLVIARRQHPADQFRR